MSRRSESMEDQSRARVVQKACRKGRKSEVGRGRRSCEREVARCCCGMGRSECHIPGGEDGVS